MELLKFLFQFGINILKRFATLIIPIIVRQITEQTKTFFKFNVYYCQCIIIHPMLFIQKYLDMDFEL